MRKYGDLMKTILELAAATQAALDEMKNDCTLHDWETCRQRFDMEIELERLMRLYEACSSETCA